MKNGKVIFINTPHPWLYDQKQQFPLGLLYAAAAVRNHGWETVIVDLAGRENDLADAPGIMQLVPGDAYAYCFGATFTDYPWCARVAAAIRSRRGTDGSYLIIIGGVHPTVTPELVDRKIFDVIYRGEAEIGLPAVLANPAIVNQHGVHSGTLLEELDDAPLPARDLLSPSSFKTASIFAHGDQKGRPGGTSIITSRGCPFCCSFCSSSEFWGERPVSVRPAISNTS